MQHTLFERALSFDWSGSAGLFCPKGISELVARMSLFRMDVRLECFKMVGAGVATVSLVGAGCGVGIVFGSLVLGISRNPQLKGVLFQYAILGFALTEAVGLLGLMMAFLILFR